MNDRNLQHPDITRIERTGYPGTTYYNDEPTRECSICGVTISEEQSAFNLCEDCEKKRGSGLVTCY